MDSLEFDGPINQPKRIYKYIIIKIFSILLGLSCFGGFITTSVKLNLNSYIIEQCKNDTQNIVLCYFRLIGSNALETRWQQLIFISLLLTYATILFFMIVETNRTNVNGLFGQMIVQILFIIVGIGVSFPVLFLPTYIYFYQSKQNIKKSPVPIDIVYLALIYVILFIIAPTYLIYFFRSNKLIVTIMMIILLLSPIGFVLISLPLRAFSDLIQFCWIINSHRLIVYSHLILFILSIPLYSIVFVSLIMHWSFDSIEQSYVAQITNIINPVEIIWSIDYISLFIGLILFICVNEYFFRGNIYQTLSSKLKQIACYIVFAIGLVLAPCLSFQLYIAWNDYQYLSLT